MISLLTLSVDLFSIIIDFLLSFWLFKNLLKIGEIQLHSKAHRAVFQTQKPGEMPFGEERLRIN